MKKEIRVEVSARHAHLTKHDLEVLFGEGYELTKEKHLSQTGEFASLDTIKLVGPKRELENVRVLGPCRGNTQIEISRTDSFYLGAPAPLRLSGKIIGSGSIKLVGPQGELELKDGLIVPKRHLHVNQDQAQDFGVSDGQNVSVMIDGPRSVTFHEVEVRIKEGFDTSIHLDTDEANAAGFDGEQRCYLIVE